MKLVTTVPRYLYHLTPRRNLARIKRVGLRPRSTRWNEARRRTYANRIYLTTSAIANEDMKQVLGDEDVRLGKRSRPDVYVQLRVSTALVPNLHLYVDPEHPRNSVFVTRRILPTAISVAEEAVAKKQPGQPRRHDVPASLKTAVHEFISAIERANARRKR